VEDPYGGQFALPGLRAAGALLLVRDEGAVVRVGDGDRDRRVHGGVAAQPAQVEAVDGAEFGRDVLAEHVSADDGEQTGAQPLPGGGDAAGGGAAGDDGEPVGVDLAAGCGQVRGAAENQVAEDLACEDHIEHGNAFPSVQGAEERSTMSIVMAG
jgi:hypothetical protein